MGIIEAQVKDVRPIVKLYKTDILWKKKEDDSGQKRNESGNGRWSSQNRPEKESNYNNNQVQAKYIR